MRVMTMLDKTRFNKGNVINMKEQRVIFTSAWKEETENIPSRPIASLVGREAKARRRLGLGSSPPCRLAR